MSLNLNKKNIFSLIIISNILSYTICIIKVPVKLVTTKFNKLINKKTLNNNPSTAMSTSLIDILDICLFAVDITFGSKNQFLTVLLDTGSDILWVSGPGSSNKNIYNPSNSITSQKSIERLNYDYALGSISGYYYTDQINFLLWDNYYTYFGVASSVNLDLYDFDGIMGLGRKYSNSKYSILNSIKKTGKITSTVFSLKYDEDKNQMYFFLGEQHEDFSIKNIEKGKYIASCPLIKSSFFGTDLWVCNIVSLGIKKDNIIIKKITFNIEGLFDTGSNNIIFPSKYISQLKQTLTSFNCFLYEEGNKQVGSQKAIYCRDENNLPKITIGLKKHILTLGKKNFYDKIQINNQFYYRLRFLFEEDTDLCIIGQSFYFEYHTLFDDSNGVLKFYNEDDSKIIFHEEKNIGIGAWAIVLIIVGGVIIVGTIVFFIVYCCFCHKKEKKILEKELLEMASITKMEDQDEQNVENNFNQIMNLKPIEKKKKGFNINVNYNI